MKKFMSALVYTALLGLANAATADVVTASALREGDMRKLNFHGEPLNGSDVAFLGEAGEELTLAHYQGKHIVLNFWATWCAPCRHEMPSLSRLQASLGGDDLEVVTIATGRNSVTGMQRFMGENGIDNLPLYTDARQSLARSMGVLGLPVTVILDPEGNEIARMQGDADWASANAQDILRALINSES